ncbi:MAG: hypothetical protein RMM30_09010 [Armatimonadota bacterium]|nr:hypothetical protein [Armatimonadota bacterium]MDW8156708.1 hypothetical protein [Armatimonadota bacterium]
MPRSALVDALGWVGAAALLLAYFLVSSRRVHGGSLLYQGLNAAGSLLLGANSLYYGAVPSAFVNLVWLAIAVYGAASGLRARG